MSAIDSRPASIAGIKHLAKSLKKNQCISHSAALDLASVRAGFSNFRHAQKHLPDIAPAHYSISVRCYWRDTETDTKGVETLVISLPLPLSKLLTKYQLAHAQQLIEFEIVDDLTFVRGRAVQYQSTAQSVVCEAARTLAFMAATGLRPSSAYSRAYPNAQELRELLYFPKYRFRHGRIPGEDHASIWYHSETKGYVIADEPYEAAVADAKVRQEREAWCECFGVSMVKPEWSGMYAPDGNSRLYLFARNEKEIPIQAMKAALDALPPPYTVKEWRGESEVMQWKR